MKIVSLFVVAVVLCAAAGVNGAVVDDFESYALDTILEGTGGWSNSYGFNSNLSSPIVKDAASGYPEFSGQFMCLIDDNSANSHPEIVTKSSSTTLSTAGDYVQLAMYASSEVLEGGPLGAQVEARVFDTGGIMLRFGIQIDYRNGNLAHWFYNDGAQHSSKFPDTINNPCPDSQRPWLDQWYVLRATLRDADIDGVVDSYDLETFDSALNPVWYELDISSQGRETADAIMVGPSGSSNAAIALIDEIEFTEIPEPATIALLSLGGLLVTRRKR